MQGRAPDVASPPGAYALKCTRCGNLLDLPQDPAAVHIDCGFCGTDNVLPPQLIEARQRPHQPHPPHLQQQPGDPRRFVPPPAGSYGQPMPRTPPNSSEAIAAIVLAAAAWMCFPLGFVAVWLGWRARILASENPDTVGGGQLGLVAMIMGGVLAGLQTLLWLGYAAFFVWLAMMHP